MPDLRGVIYAPVFPAHAGMSRKGHVYYMYSWGFPRSRGDEPSLFWEGLPEVPFSPLTRG